MLEPSQGRKLATFMSPMRYSWFFYLFILPIISVFGIVGNLTSISILNRKPFAVNILFAYFMSLSLCDLFYLASNLAYVILSYK